MTKTEGNVVIGSAVVAPLTSTELSASTTTKPQPDRIWQRITRQVSSVHENVDRTFHRTGLSIALHPWRWILLTFCINLLCGLGILLWREDVDDVELYMPKGSIIYDDSVWVKKNFRDDMRYESVIVTAPNIFEPEVLNTLNEMENAIKTIVVNKNTWQDVCAGYLTWFENENDSKSGIDEDNFVTRILEQMNKTLFDNGCIYQSIMKLWPENTSERIANLTKDLILNYTTTSIKERKGNLLLDIEPLLSGVTYDEETGLIKSANATIMNWILKKSNTNSAAWEEKFIDRVLYSNRTLPAGMEIHAIAFRSFNDFLKKILYSNLAMLSCGIFLIVFYVMAMIGKCDVIEARIYLSLLGVSVVGQSILSSYGICFYFGYSYGPVHPILPFLLLGIGVDDMFVIMHSFDNLSEADKTLALPLRIAKALQQSGMSISVTSITNAVAFGVGITTTMPFLRSFCMFATMGIFFLYIYQITFFVPCLVFDQRRLEAKKDSFCCRPVPTWKPSDCTRNNWQRHVFEKYIGPLLTKTYAKIVILVTTAILLCVNSWALCQIEQNFDPLWYLDQDSYPIHFNEKLKEYFPNYGKQAGIYLAGVNYYEDRDDLFQLVQDLKRNPYINNQTLNPWFAAYEEWLDKNNMTSEITSSEEYYGNLPEYVLLTKEGQAYIKDIKFDRLPISDYNITVSKIEIQHILLNTTAKQIKAMQSVRDAIAATNFTKKLIHVALFSPDYVSWSANKIIGDELLRNLILEILAIGVVTLILLRNLLTFFWVVCCVGFTLVDLLGFMYFLGLTIEISSSVIVLICAGLSVDFAAHIGLEFTRARGTKNERVISTLRTIGPAVFNGGFSTFLAFVLLATSKAYLFSTFFKLFTCVVVFGLFHGLLFLPVILSILGPSESIKKDVVKEHPLREQNGYFTVRLSEDKKEGEFTS